MRSLKVQLYCTHSALGRETMAPQPKTYIPLSLHAVHEPCDVEAQISTTILLGRLHHYSTQFPSRISNAPVLRTVIVSLTLIESLEGSL